MILILDNETTSVDADAEICEIAFLQVDENLNVLWEFESLVNPVGLISPSASGASGITNRMVESSPTIEQVVGAIDISEPITLIAHNCQFDRRFVEPFWEIKDSCCTLRAARQLYPESPDHKLSTLRYFLELGVDETAHRAMGDVRVTYALLKAMLEDTGLALLEFIEEVNKPVEVTHIPFGKHKGKELTALPFGYVKWLLSLDNLDSDLTTCLKKTFNL